MWRHQAAHQPLPSHPEAAEPAESRQHHQLLAYTWLRSNNYTISSNDKRSCKEEKFVLRQPDISSVVFYRPADEEHHLHQVPSGCLRLDERIVDVHIRPDFSFTHLVELHRTVHTSTFCAEL